MLSEFMYLDIPLSLSLSLFNIKNTRIKSTKGTQIVSVGIEIKSTLHKQNIFAIIIFVEIIQNE